MKTIRRWKLKFWRKFAPRYRPLINTLVKYHLLYHKGRQRYAIGRLAPGKTTAELQNYLHAQGFEHCLLAWVDEGEILSLRKVDQEVFHYHLRVFKDEEIRGHYEYMGEHYAIRHVLEWGLESRTEEFKHMLEGWIT